MGRPKLHVKSFAQIKEAIIEFGDLTILVGPQASGKSLLLQLWKFALDRQEIVPALRDAGDDVSSREALLDSVLGQGMHLAWTEHTIVEVDGETIDPDRLGKWIRGRKKPSAFFVPAHRGILLAEGWAQPFGRMNANVPVVARLFSHALYERFVDTGAGDLSPQPRDLKKEYRDAIDGALFHGGSVKLLRREGHSNFRLSLSFGKADLPFMTWTAGQREFTPLLFGLMRLLPPRKTRKIKDLDWVIIEEPEMGLHPQAISVFMMLVLELLYRGYKVVLSTHSQLVVDVAWAIKRFQHVKADPKFLLKALTLPQSASMKTVAREVMKKDVRVFALYVGARDFRVRSTDISNLDPSSEDEIESGWGGLTGFSSDIGNTVAQATNASGAVE